MIKGITYKCPVCNYTTILKELGKGEVLICFNCQWQRHQTNPMFPKKKAEELRNKIKEEVNVS